MRKNKGFTYYELLLVIAIMSLMVGFTTIGIASARRNNVNRMADKVESAAKQARNSALSKGNSNGYLTLYYTDHKLYSYVGEKITTVPDVKTMNLIATNVDALKVSYYNSGSSASYVLTSGVFANVGFKQSTGEVSGLELPQAFPGTRFPGDIEIKLSNGNDYRIVEIKQYGSISIK